MSIASRIWSTLRQWLPVVGQWVASVAVAIYRSFANLVKSPAVWLACGAVFVGGFVAGYSGPAHRLQEVKTEHRAAAAALASAKQRVAVLTARVSKAEKEAEEARAEAAAAMERHKPKPQPAAKQAPAKRIPTKG